MIPEIIPATAPALFSQLIYNAIKGSGEPALGHYLGSQLSVITRGHLGHAILSSDNSQQAVELAIRYFKVHTPFAVPYQGLQDGDVLIALQKFYLLGCSAPSNFSRAFNKWSGISPVHYREQTHQDSPD